MLFVLFTVFSIVSSSLTQMSPKQEADVKDMILHDPKGIVGMMQHAPKSDVKSVIGMLNTRIHDLDDKKQEIDRQIALNHAKQKKFVLKLKQRRKNQNQNINQ